MNFKQAIISCFHHYATFTGRAPRSEFWYWVLFTFLAATGLSFIDTVVFGYPQGLLSNLFSLAVIVPGIAVSVRRLHDVNRSGWWLLVGLIPFVGIILLIVWYCTQGDTGDNQFGADPLSGVSPAMHNTPIPPAPPSQSQQL